MALARPQCPSAGVRPALSESSIKTHGLRGGVANQRLPRSLTGMRTSVLDVPGCRRNCCVTYAMRNRPPFSFRQLQIDLEDKTTSVKNTIREIPVVAAVRNWFSTTLLPPVSAVMAAFSSWKFKEQKKYYEFAKEEAKKEWAWNRQTEKERAVWKGVISSTAVLIASLYWQIFIPVSVVLGLLIPMYVSHVVYDHPIFSPIGLSILLISPLKYLPGVYWVWLV